VDAKRWQRQWQLFHEALELAPAARAGWLNDTCADDDALREEVAALLRAHEDADTPLDRAPTREDRSDLQVGQVVGRFRVVRELGQGGMGRVFLVERAEGDFVQRGALKLLAPNFGGQGLVQRFARERQILANLDHPNIARLLDGGSLGPGAPYLVMAYVEGEPIDAYCARTRARLAERLRLILQLCDALDYAHRHLVVHRDLKPGNVLVDTEGRAVLLDFGIAKLLDTTGDDRATEAHGLRLFTARYASPEQLRGEPMGTATDVYSLGVLLYELIATRAPYDSADRAPERVAERIETQPPPTLGRRAPWGEALPTELDWIVRRALAADPARRYASAAALADDVRALLAHRPVAARPDSLAYRARKLLRRRWPWAAAVVAFVAMASLFTVRLAREGERTRLALEQTRVERDRSQRTAEFLADLFKQADSTQQGGAEISVGELLERGRRALTGRDDLAPTARATLLNSLADVHRNLGLYRDAADLAEQSLHVADAMADATARGDALLRLGQARQLAGEHRDARAALTQAVSLRDAGGDALAIAEATEWLAINLLSLGERAAAKPLFERTLTLRAERLPPNDPRLADAALRLGSWYWTAGELDEAARWYDQALRALRQAAVSDLPALARALDANAALAQRQGRYAQALPLYEEALSLRRRVLGDEHRMTADTLSNLGACRFDAGDAVGAESALREALAIFERVLPPNAAPMAKTLNNLALVRQQRRALDEARVLYERALSIHRAAYGDNHALVASTLNNLGLVAEDADDPATARARYEQALRIFEATVGAEDPQLGFVLTNLARARFRQGAWADARALFERALALRQAHLPADHPSLAETTTWFGYARCVSESGDSAQAGVALLRSTLATREAKLGDKPATQETRALLGACLRHQGALAEAKSLLDVARAPLIERRGANDWLVREIYGHH
jgi:serine/threonine-protein kinase